MVVVHKDLARGSIEEMLRTYPFVRFNPAMGVGRVIDATLRERKILINDFMEFDSIEAMISIVKLKLGVTVIPVGLVSPSPTDSLRTISFDPPVHRGIGIVTRRGMMDAPAIRTVAEAFKSLSIVSVGRARKRSRKKP